MATEPAIAMAVMGKASAPGRTKTRLVPPLSAEQAARLNTAFLQDIVGNLLQAKCSADIAPYIAYGPAGSEQFFRDWLPREVGLIECSLPDFGACLFRAVCTLLSLGHAAACVLNADSPTLPTAYLIAAARALAEPGDRMVIGPSTDGGYYFLGVKQPHRALFENIEWSTARVFEQTCRRAAALDLPCVVLDTWYDVDDAHSLQRLRAELHANLSTTTAAGAPLLFGAPRTRAALLRDSERWAS